MCNFRILLLMSATLLLARCAASEESALQNAGIESERPHSGAFVPLGNRFMIPYSERIPGTDITFEMVPVPGGIYLMGSPEKENEREPDEGPPRSIRIDPMWVGKCEVTQLEYHEFELLFEIFVEIELKGENAEPKLPQVVTAPTPLFDPNYTFEFGMSGDMPAVTMSQYAAQQYTKWLSLLTKRQYRLPSEAEWEYACRAGSQTAFSWGDDSKQVENHAWFFDNSPNGYSPVGRKQPNAFGLYDMHGNVAEWTVNAHTPDGYGWFDSLDPSPEQKTVRWPKTVYPCVVRGGSWQSTISELRSANRVASDESWQEEDACLPSSPWWHASQQATAVGFRLFRSARDLPTESIARYWDHTSSEVHRDVLSSLQNGRARVGILDERFMPAAEKYKDRRQEILRNLQGRRNLRGQRGSRPAAEE